jgi:hypothetical protein
MTRDEIAAAIRSLQTRAEILCMVREAQEQTMKELPPNTFDLDLFHERFFALAYEAGAAAEREACAKVCDPYTHGQWFAAAIRAREDK